MFTYYVNQESSYDIYKKYVQEIKKKFPSFESKLDYCAEYMKTIFTKNGDSIEVIDHYDIDVVMIKSSIQLDFLNHFEIVE